MNTTGTGDLASTKPEETITPDDFNKAVEALKNSKVHQQALAGLLAPLFNRIIGESIDAVENVLPAHQTNSEQRAQFAKARQRILRVGNNSIREMETHIKDFVVHQVYKREVVARVVAQSDGPFNLPNGLKIREKDQTNTHGKR